MARRANREGSVYKLKSGPKKGQWIACLSIGCDASGKRVRRTKVARTQTDALALLAEMKDDLKNGLLDLPKHPTVSEYLKRWLDDIVEPSSSGNTTDLYRNAAVKHIGPKIGGVRLDDLTAMHVQGMLSAWRKAGVGTRTQQVGLSTLSRACGVAVGMGLIRTNPCKHVTRPTSTRKEIDPFTAEEANAVLAAAKDTEYEPLIVLAFTTGMRIGELFGLRWSDVDLHAGVIRVEQQVKMQKGKPTKGTLKTPRSRRTIELTPSAVAILVSHRADLLRDGQASQELVFAAPRGGLMSRHNFTARVWRPLLKKAKTRLRTPHEVRHTYATLALGAGVPIHVVSGVLGHARASITLDTYGHVLKTHQAAARDAIARLLG